MSPSVRIGGVECLSLIEEAKSSRELTDDQVSRIRKAYGALGGSRVEFAGFQIHEALNSLHARVIRERGLDA